MLQHAVSGSSHSHHFPGVVEPIYLGSFKGHLKFAAADRVRAERFTEAGAMAGKHESKRGESGAKGP